MRKKQRKKKKTEKQKKITNCKCASFYVLGLVSLINKAWYRKGKKQKHFTKFTKGGDVCFCVWTFHVATELSVISKLWDTQRDTGRVTERHRREHHWIWGVRSEWYHDTKYDIICREDPCSRTASCVKCTETFNSWTCALRGGQVKWCIKCHLKSRVFDLLLS